MSMTTEQAHRIAKIAAIVAALGIAALSFTFADPPISQEQTATSTPNK